MAATLDALETRGVAVVGYRTDTLPAFTTASSGLPLGSRVDSPEEAAALVRAHRALGLPGAVVLAQPVPEHVALDRAEMEFLLEARKKAVVSERLAKLPALDAEVAKSLMMKANTFDIVPAK